MPNIRLTDLRRALAVALALAAAAPATADPPAARAAEEAAGRTFRDWRLDCAGEACRVRTEVAGRDGAPVLTLSVEGAGDTARLVLRTPLPLHLPDGIALGLGDPPPRPIAWRTCDAAGCEAETPLDADLRAALERERTAEVTLTLADGVRVRLPASLLGFTAAARAAAAVSPP